jgi:dephospho-CoA kinase
MKVIGLVGESGTGKSTIAAHLEARGAGCVDADGLAHTALRDDPRVERMIRERFGDDVFTDGEIDRKKLGTIVFDDAAALEALNRIVHPAVIEGFLRQLEAFENAGFELAVVDAALLLEVDVPFDIDLVIALRASREEQTRRLIAKGGVSRAEVTARLDNQAHIEKSFYRADVLLDTNRPLSDVLSEIDDLVQVLLEDGGGPDKRS